MKTAQHRMALVAAILGNAIWGFSFLFTRTALQVLSVPAVLLSIRFVFAFFLMSIPLLMGKAHFSLKGKKWGALLLLGLVEPVCFLFESYGILYTNATFAGVVMSVSPIVSIFLAAIFLREFPNRLQLLFCFVPVAGVIIMAISGSQLGVVTPLGLLLLMGNCITAGTYRAVNRKSSQEFSAFERTYAVLGISALGFTLVALIQLKGDLSPYRTALADPTYLGCVAVLAVFCSVTAYLLVNYSSAHMSVAKISAFGAVSTLCAAFAGIVFLREPVSWPMLLGAALVILGVWQVNLRGQ